jgi:hypothetical protein
MRSDDCRSRPRASHDVAAPRYPYGNQAGGLPSRVAAVFVRFERRAASRVGRWPGTEGCRMTGPDHYLAGERPQEHARAMAAADDSPAR